MCPYSSRSVPVPQQVLRIEIEFMVSRPVGTMLLGVVRVITDPVDTEDPCSRAVPTGLDVWAWDTTPSGESDEFYIMRR